MNKIFLFVLFSSVLVSCDPVINVDFNVKNESGHSIVVVVKPDTFMLEDGSVKTIYHENDLGSTDEYIDNLEFWPFDTISIWKDGGQVYNKKPMDVARWQKTKPKKKNGLGTVDLIVKESDF